MRQIATFMTLLNLRNIIVNNFFSLVYWRLKTGDGVSRAKGLIGLSHTTSLPRRRSYGFVTQSFLPHERSWGRNA